MKVEFSIGKQSYVIDKVTIKDYYGIRTKLFLEGNEAELSIVSALSGCPIQQLKKIQLEDWEQIMLVVNSLLTGIISTKNKILQKFTHKNVEYGLVDFNTLTIGEFSDLDVIITSDNSDYRLHEILAILYRPITGIKWNGHKLQEYDYDGFRERCEIFTELPVSYAQTIVPFFLDIGQQYLNRTKIYLNTLKNKETKEIIQKTQEIITVMQNSGTEPFSSSLEKTHLNFLQLQNLALEKLSTSWLTVRNRPLKQKGKIKKWLNNIIK